MNVVILFPYHNNMHDAYMALQQLGRVRFASRRVSKLTSDVENIQPRVRRMFGWRFYDPFSLWSLLGRETDVVILKHLADPLNLIPHLICALKKIKVIVITQHTPLPMSPAFWWVWGAFLRWQKTKVMATTKEGVAAADRLSLKVDYIPACIDPQQWQPSEKRVALPRALRLLTVAKFQPRKNLVSLIEALGLLRHEYPDIDIRLTIVGALSERAEALEAWREVKQKIAAESLEESVSLETNQTYDHMPNLYQQADLFILTAEREPLGYAVVEAMAAGLPVVVSADTGAASYVGSGTNGSLLKDVTPKEITREISNFIAAKEVQHVTLRRFGEASQYIIKTQHSPKVFLQKFSSLVS